MAISNQIVTSKEEVIQNIESFSEMLDNARISDDATSDKFIHRLTKYKRWYALPIGNRSAPPAWLFAPSIWVGYRDMDEFSYRLRRLGEDDLHGWDTEGVLSRWFRRLAPQDPEYGPVHRALASRLALFGKQPRKDCTVAIVDTAVRDAAEAAEFKAAKREIELEKREREVAALLIKVARGLSEKQRARILKALSR